LPPGDRGAGGGAVRSGHAVASAEVSGPGFINITLADKWITAEASGQLANARLGVRRPT
jgi:arginyl-tRNA synthetase